MRKHMYLHTDKKSKIIKYRREYPQDVQAIIGKQWFIYSMKTKDAQIANSRFREADTAFDDIVNENRIRQYTIPAKTQKILLPILQAYQIKPFNPRSKDMSFAELVLAQNTLTGKLRIIYEKIAISPQDAEVIIMLGLNRVNVTTALPTLKSLFLQVENALRESKGETAAPESECDAILAELGINPIRVSSAPQNSFNGYTKVPNDSQNGILLSEAFELWKNNDTYGSKNITDRKYAVTRFIELHDDLRIVDITRNHFKEYIKVLNTFPVIRSHKVRKLPIQEILKLISEEKIDTSDLLASRTIKKMCDGLRAIIAVAIDEKGLNINNRASNLKIKVTNKYNRAVFSDNDLRKLFNAPLYVGYRDNKRKDAGSVITRDAYYWLPLIGLYTGAREEEIAQLRVNDIKITDGINYFNINTIHEDQKLKNDNSRRNVPIHSELIKCGFLEYVENLRGNNVIRLFPELRMDASEKRYSKDFSEDFTAI